MLYRPVGCDACNDTGYRGRTGIYELMVLDDDIRQMIAQEGLQRTIKQQPRVAKGMRTLLDDGARKVLRGHHHLGAEVLSVTQEDMA